MKKNKLQKIFVLMIMGLMFCALTFVFAGCSNKESQSLNSKIEILENEISKLEDKIEKLEEKCEVLADDDKDYCTVLYDLNFKNTDYNVLKSCFDKGLSFDVDGFVEHSNIVEKGNVDLVYSKQIELGRGFVLYEFQDDVLNSYFDGWYTSSDIRVFELTSIVNTDITLYAKWKEDLKTLTSAGGRDFEYYFNEEEQTASFYNGTASFSHNGVGYISLPEVVFNDGKFYVVNDISTNYSREHMVYIVPKTYTGSVSFPIIFPNKDESGDSSLTYLGDYISQQIGSVICIYKADYTKNTLKLLSIEEGSTYTSNPYLTLGKNITLCRVGDSQRTLKIIGFCFIYPATDDCPYTKFIISKDVDVEFPTYWNVFQNNDNQPIDVFFELTKDELADIDSGLIGSSAYETRYYYSDTEPTDGYNYWHYDTDGKTPVIWESATE
ncbi:MAG: hypothetical protein IJW59_02195 [Clostridia bacterium]|nr:hypothetical protein [Clostridia bacterium]